MHAHLLGSYIYANTEKERDPYHKCTAVDRSTRTQMPAILPPLPTQDELCSRVTTISFRGWLVHMGFPKSSVMWTLAFKQVRVKPLQIITACRGGGTHHSEVAVQRPAVKGMTKEPVQLLLDCLGDHCPVRQ